MAKKLWALRISEDDLAEIKRRAETHQLSATEYIVRCALGEPLDRETVDARLGQLEARVNQLICREAAR